MISKDVYDFFSMQMVFLAGDFNAGVRLKLCVLKEQAVPGL